MVAEPTGLAARWAGRVVFDGPAVDVGEVFCDGGAGDSDAEFDGSADGVGDKVSSLVHGSCDVFGFGLGTFLLVSQGPLHLFPHLITGGSTHALQIRNSQILSCGHGAWRTSVSGIAPVTKESRAG